MEQNHTMEKTVKAISLVTMITLVAKLLGIVREALQANTFGTTLQFDLYSTAYNHTIYLFTTLAYALCVAAVPIISKKLSEGKKAVERSAGNLITACVILCLAICALGFVLVRFAPLERWFEFQGEAVEKLRGYLNICLPTLPLIVLIYLLVAVFQSMGNYSLQGSLSLPYNLALILFLLFFAGSEQMTEYVAAVCFAWLLQLAMILPVAWKRRFVLRPGLRLRDPDLKLFGRTALVTLFTTSIFLWCYLADTNTVQPYGDGAVSGVYYADKLFSPVATTLIYSISIVLFPKYNRAFTRTDDDGYKRYVGSTLNSTLFVILPFSALLGAFALPVVRVLFERGSFDSASSAVTASIFSMYSLGMAGFCVLDLTNKAYYTMRKTLTPLLINGVVLLLNLVLNRLLASNRDPGLIALATSVSLSCGGVLALICFFRRSKNALALSRLVKEIICAVITGVLAYLCSGALPQDQSKIRILVEYALLGLLGLAVYGALCWLLGDREALRTMFKRVRKGRD